LLFASSCRVSLSYGALLRLAVVAMTPCIIIKTVFALAGVQLPCIVLLLYFVITLAYLYYGVHACSQIPLTEQEIRNPEQTQM
ncbi:MAG: DUF1189 domain-containing protein, partial [Phycisphaerae bacterium]|nr:DUF1189 domain-containing protein [Phycisphaerae bacterium]